MRGFHCDIIRIVTGGDRFLHGIQHLTPFTDLIALDFDIQALFDFRIAGKRRVVENIAVGFFNFKVVKPPVGIGQITAVIGRRTEFLAAEVQFLRKCISVLYRGF